MKKIIAGTAVLSLLAASACNVEAVSSDDSAHTDTCPSCAEADFHLRVTVDPGLGARMSVIYQSTKDSLGCTDLVWDMLNPKRVPEQFREQLTAAAITEGPDGELNYDFAFQHDAGDSCASQVRHIYLEPTDRAEEAEPWASLEYSDSDDYGNEPQVVECSDANGQLNCGNDLLYHSLEGRSQVHLQWR